jgi:ribonucleoside-triphosphate reductase
MTTEHNTSPFCQLCGSDQVYGISRVVGYFSVIGNWNKSKQAELKRRQKGKYWEK